MPYQLSPRPLDAFHFKELLLKYLWHVMDVAGTDFLGDRYGPSMEPAFVAELRELSKLANCDGNSPTLDHT